MDLNPFSSQVLIIADLLPEKPNNGNNSESIQLFKLLININRNPHFQKKEHWRQIKTP